MPDFKPGDVVRLKDPTSSWPHTTRMNGYLWVVIREAQTGVIVKSVATGHGAAFFAEEMEAADDE